jgi:hypothetical protein
MLIVKGNRSHNTAAFTTPYNFCQKKCCHSREKDDLLGILSIESTDNDHVFSMNKAKMKRISEVEANRIVDDLTNQDRSLPIVGINGHTKEKKFFDLADLLIEKVILSS